MKNLAIYFFWVCSIKKLQSISGFLHKFYILKQSSESSPWDMYRNALSLPIFKSIIFPKQGDKMVSFFACWYKFMKIKSWLGNFSWAWSKIGFATLVTKLIVSQKWMHGINSFFAGSYKFRKVKSYISDFGWM